MFDNLEIFEHTYAVSPPQQAGQGFFNAPGQSLQVRLTA